MGFINITRNPNNFKQIHLDEARSKPAKTFPSFKKFAMGDEVKINQKNPHEIFQRRIAKPVIPDDIYLTEIDSFFRPLSK